MKPYKEHAHEHQAAAKHVLDGAQTDGERAIFARATQVYAGKTADFAQSLDAAADDPAKVRAHAQFLKDAARDAHEQASGLLKQLGK